MKEITTKYIIVGAGLSGLTSAYMLHKLGETDFIVLESRDRIGGRIHTQQGIDLGATWFQSHHTNVSDLLDEVGIGKFHQYSKGKSVLVYSTMAPAHYFENDPNAPSAFRIEGGSTALIQALAKPNLDKIKTATTVQKITEVQDQITVTTDTNIYKAQKIICTIPPQIVSRIEFSPPLPKKVVQVMDNTHTWMSNAMKVGLTFTAPFWREKNLSGTLIGQVGAVTELYDHSDYKEENYALMGFINEGLRDVSPFERKTRILEHLQKYLGDEVLEHISYQEKDWSQDKNTACEHIKSIYMSPRYGNPIFREWYLNGKMLFSGAETSPIYGGYMDGAIYSGLQVVKNIMQHLTS